MVKLDKQKERERTSLKLDPDKYWELKEVAVHKRVTVTELIDEAIEDVITKYRTGKPKK